MIWCIYVLPLLKHRDKLERVRKYAATMVPELADVGHEEELKILQLILPRFYINKLIWIEGISGN